VGVDVEDVLLHPRVGRGDLSGLAGERGRALEGWYPRWA
jgi:hypothetical protein